MKSKKGILNFTDKPFSADASCPSQFVGWLYKDSGKQSGLMTSIEPLTLITYRTSRVLGNMLRISYEIKRKPGYCQLDNQKSIQLST